jgi:hypothetical protein
MHSTGGPTPLLALRAPNRALVVSVAVTALSLCAFERNEKSNVDDLIKLHADGNYKEAYDGLRDYVLDPSSPSDELPQALNVAIACLQQLNRVDEVDAFREAAADVHKDDWRLLAAVAQSYLNVEHFGYMIAGQFERGQHRGGGKLVNANARDRVRAMQLFQRAMKAAESADDKREPANVLKQFADAVLMGNGNGAWRLQLLTDLDELPDYEDGWGYGGDPQGAPVDENNDPIFYSVPKSWDAARSDGERWRWLLETMVEWDSSRRDDERSIRAEFLREQFGVQTMAEYRILLARQLEDDSKDRPNRWVIYLVREYFRL